MAYELSSSRRSLGAKFDAASHLFFALLLSAAPLGVSLSIVTELQRPQARQSQCTVHMSSSFLEEGSEEHAVGKRSPVMSLATLDRTTTQPRILRHVVTLPDGVPLSKPLVLPTSRPAPCKSEVSDVLASGGDSRVVMCASGANAYHCPPHPVDGAIVRGSCTGSPPTEIGFRSAAEVLHRLGQAPAASAVGMEMEDVRRRLHAALKLPQGSAIILTASGTCAEYIPLAIARELNPTAPILSVHTAEGETGSGGMWACGGKYFNAMVPLDPGSSREEGTGVPGFHDIDLIAIPARDASGCQVDAPAALAEALRLKAHDEERVFILRDVVGTKTGFETDDLAAALTPEQRERAYKVVDLCQMRKPLGDVAKHAVYGSMVLLTGSKFFQGSAFSAAVVVPAEIVAKLIEGAAVAPPLPAGLGDFISQHEVPPSFGSWREQLPTRPNTGLLARWHTALPLIEAVADIEPSRAAACERVWTKRIERLVEATPGLEVFHEELGIVSIALRRPGQRLALKDELRQVHKWMASDLSAFPCASAPSAAATPVFIGQPVVVGDFAILRLALGAELLADLHMRSLHDETDDAIVVQKLGWINANFDALYAWGGANLPFDLSELLGEGADGYCGELPERCKGIGKEVAYAQQTLRECDAICFDVDSTLITREIIVEIAEANGVGEEVQAITALTQGGGLPFHEALTRRLALMKPSTDDLQRELDAKPPHEILSPGVHECVSLLRERGVRVFLVSGGFRQMIEPIADEIGVSRSDIYSNTLLHHEDGSFRCHCPDEFTSRAGGKADAIVDLKKKHGFRKVVMVGDGATDMEAREVEGGADAFIGYGGCKVRRAVMEGSDWYVHTFDELSRALRE